MRAVQFCLIEFIKFIVSIKIMFKTNKNVSTRCFSSSEVVISEEFFLFLARKRLTLSITKLRLRAGRRRRRI